MIQNGAVCIKNNRIYWEYQIPALDAEQIYDFMDKRKIPIIVYKGKKENFNIFYKRMEIKEKPKPFVEVENIGNFYNITGISTLIPNISIEKTREEIETIIKDKFQLIYSKGDKFSWLEITPIEARNDLDVLNTVGYPIVVENSVKELKEKFTIVIDSVFNEGVAKYLNKLFNLEINDII
jgi:hydroxymethylpyrimidine pyrophosphatase-like HAD family hydrolase